MMSIFWVYGNVCCANTDFIVVANVHQWRNKWYSRMNTSEINERKFIQNNIHWKQFTWKKSHNKTQQKDYKNTAACSMYLWMCIMYVIERHTIDAHKSSVRQTHVRTYTCHAKIKRLLSTKHHWQHSLIRSLVSFFLSLVYKCVCIFYWKLQKNWIKWVM